MINIDRALGRSRFMMLAVLCLGASGCLGTGGDFERFPVEGMVTLDGASLETGKILFNPQQEGASSFGEITDGKFSLVGPDGLSPGPYRVEIYSMKLTGKKIPNADDPGNLIDETLNVVPRRYNAQSTLSTVVPAGGAKEPLSFALTSETSKSRTSGGSKTQKH